MVNLFTVNTMKHLNLDPELEKRKAEIMKQFRENEAHDDKSRAESSASVGVSDDANAGANDDANDGATVNAPQAATVRVQVASPTVAKSDSNLDSKSDSESRVESHTESAPRASTPDADELKSRVVEALKGIYDPEIPVNIYDLGLIYEVDIRDAVAAIQMTLTTPGCPVAQTFPGMVEGAVKLVPGITDAVVELVWEPPWTQARISEAARLELGLI